MAEVTEGNTSGTDAGDGRPSGDALHGASQRLNAIINNTRMAVFMMDDRQHCVFMNRAAEELTGYCFEETQGRPLHDVIHHKHPDGRPYPLEECPIDRAFPEDDQVQGEEVFVHKDGHFYPVAFTASPVRDETGKPIGTVIEARDISEEKQAQEALREQSRILETLNRTGAALSGELDLQKVVQMVTDAGVELTGAEFGAFFYNVVDQRGESYMLYTLSGADPSQFNFGMPRNTAVFHPTFSGTGTIRSGDITRDSRYGKSAPHYGMPKGHLPVRSYLAVPVIGRSGEVLGGLFFGHEKTGCFTDAHERLMEGLASQAAISIDNARLYQAVQRTNELLEQRVVERTAELEHANEALRQAQKMEAIGQLTGGIAHDFNNMLTVILGSADVLKRPGLDDEKRTRYVDAIAETADRAARLTSQLLAFARRQALKPETFDAAQRVKTVAEMLRTLLGSRIRLEVLAECDDCIVVADPTQFEAALVNMAVNARDAMNGEGTLEIRVEAVAGPPPDLANLGGAFVAVSVADSGHGIATENLDKIFEPFFTTKSVGKGTGLGLSQVYGFVKQSGGEIAVQSKPGEGATFTFYLPQAESAGLTSRDAVESVGEHGHGGRVLVVEDNRDVGSFAEQVLADLGYESTLAANAAEAMALLGEDGRAFDVVFSDIVMPGMDGIEFARQVRDKWPSLPVVLTSGYSHVLSDRTPTGFPLLQKPYSLESLQRALSEVLRG